ncbi:hypothetical protein NEHOM01_1620 [Nematocida homosporus]|uniref:uncharacterized protein n=1 Tax=Nematocida homosporus TaxID=1912981 RepID=UPI00221FE0CA|nr:uncharacterized protein NEHOM01_1620 [Nematocida homosporus]KAI5186667.1 hypothetical protein NEHOM01_1620 [Nematocida homosporus]
MEDCRYFLRGNCRFGKACRFKHTKKSSIFSPPIWILSSYTDNDLTLTEYAYSFEEVRAAYYSAKQTSESSLYNFFTTWNDLVTSAHHSLTQAINQLTKDSSSFLGDSDRTIDIRNPQYYPCIINPLPLPEVFHLALTQPLPTPTSTSTPFTTTTPSSTSFTPSNTPFTTTTNTTQSNTTPFINTTTTTNYPNTNTTTTNTTPLNSTQPNSTPLNSTLPTQSNSTQPLPTQPTLTQFNLSTTLPKKEIQNNPKKEIQNPNQPIIYELGNIPLRPPGY